MDICIYYIFIHIQYDIYIVYIYIYIVNLTQPKFSSSWVTRYLLKSVSWVTRYLLKSVSPSIKNLTSQGIPGIPHIGKNCRWSSTKTKHLCKKMDNQNKSCSLWPTLRTRNSRWSTLFWIPFTRMSPEESGCFTMGMSKKTWTVSAPRFSTHDSLVSKRTKRNTHSQRSWCFLDDFNGCSLPVLCGGTGDRLCCRTGALK